MPDALEELLDSLLFEGYALYPYTPGATKNATPTPFGILYPSSYAEGSSSTYEHLRLCSVLHAPPEATLSAEVRFLAPAGEGHRAAPHRIALDPVAIAEMAPDSGPEALRTLRRSVQGAAGELEVEVALRARRLRDGSLDVSLTVRNATACERPAGRSQALARSLISTHPVLSVSAGRFASPLQSPGGSVNTFPVLASAEDRTVIGAAIVLPDHPQIAPESRGSLFDGTEIEEALLLHVLALSDGEREDIEREDPRVAEMLARASAAVPEDIMALHGRVTLADPPEERSRCSDTPPTEPPGLVDPTAGEAEAEVDGVRFRRGGRVRIRPGGDADLQARMLDGRTARIERILTDYDGKVHLGLTIDDDPGQQLMSETGRFLYFFAPEVEVIQ